MIFIQEYQQLKPDKLEVKQSWFGKNCDIAHVIDKHNQFWYNLDFVYFQDEVKGNQTSVLFA